MHIYTVLKTLENRHIFRLLIIRKNKYCTSHLANSTLMISYISSSVYKICNHYLSIVHTSDIQALTAPSNLTVIHLNSVNCTHDNSEKTAFTEHKPDQRDFKNED